MLKYVVRFFVTPTVVTGQVVVMYVIVSVVYSVVSGIDALGVCLFN